MFPLPVPLLSAQMERRLTVRRERFLSHPLGILEHMSGVLPSIRLFGDLIPGGDCPQEAAA